MSSSTKSGAVGNKGLSQAKSAKQDEFYTQYVDIQKEIEAYLEFDPNTFRDKVVYCNCDDPFESNFFKFFAANFDRLGLKQLISTSYQGSNIAGVQLTLEEYIQGKKGTPKPSAIALKIDGVTDLNGDGATGIDDVRLTPIELGGTARRNAALPMRTDLVSQAFTILTPPAFSMA